MPKLLLINVALNWGSTGKIVEGIGTLAQTGGWEVFVAHGARYKNLSTTTSIQVSSKVGEWIHYVNSSLFDAQGLGSRCETKQFLKQVEEIKPDIVHIHNIHGCYINYPLLFTYLKEHNIPVVWTLHDCWAMTGHCVHFMRSNCMKWQAMCHHCPQKKTFPSSYLFDRSERNYKLKRDLFTSMPVMHITTVSSWLKGVAEVSYLKKYPVSVVPNGIKTDVFNYEPSDILERFGLQGKKLLLAVAIGLDERKGLYDYIKLANKLPDQYQLMLVGLTEEESKTLPENIIAEKRTNSTRELAAYYSAADALLSLSYEETFGLTIIEAMACGTPAIVYDNTAQPELVTLETGMIVPTGDIEALVKAIEEVCSKPKESYSIACRNHSLEYDEKLSYQKYLDIYSVIINKQ